MCRAVDHPVPTRDRDVVAVFAEIEVDAIDCPIEFVTLPIGDGWISPGTARTARSVRSRLPVGSETSVAVAELCRPSDARVRVDRSSRTLDRAGLRVLQDLALDTATASRFLKLVVPFWAFCLASVREVIRNYHPYPRSRFEYECRTDRHARQQVSSSQRCLGPPPATTSPHN